MQGAFQKYQRLIIENCFGETKVVTNIVGDEHWVDNLKTTASGKWEKSSSNIMLILENDPRINK